LTLYDDMEGIYDTMLRTFEGEIRTEDLSTTKEVLNQSFGVHAVFLGLNESALSALMKCSESFHDKLSRLSAAGLRMSSTGAAAAPAPPSPPPPATPPIPPAAAAVRAPTPPASPPAPAPAPAASSLGTARRPGTGLALLDQSTGSGKSRNLSRLYKAAKPAVAREGAATPPAGPAAPPKNQGTAADTGLSGAEPSTEPATAAPQGAAEEGTARMGNQELNDVLSLLQREGTTRTPTRGINQLLEADERHKPAQSVVQQSS